MELGISSYTYVWWAGVSGYPPPPTPLTVEALLECAASLDLRVVQIADNLPLDRLPEPELSALAARARERGIHIEVGTRGIQPEVLRRYLRIAVRLGSPILRTLLDSPGHQPPQDEAVTMLREAVPEFERAQVTLAIENHDRLKAVDLRRIVERIGSSSVGICLDTANSLGCGEGIEQVLETLADLVVNVHIKDFIIRRLPHNKGFLVEGAPAGQGQLDIPALLRGLERSHRDLSAILELWTPPQTTTAASVEREKAWAVESIRYLRTLIPVSTHQTV